MQRIEVTTKPSPGPSAFAMTGCDRSSPPVDATITAPVQRRLGGAVRGRWRKGGRAGQKAAQVMPDGAKTRTTIAVAAPGSRAGTRPGSAWQFSADPG